MSVMSRRMRVILLGALLATAGFSARYALANAASLDADAYAAALVPSSPPALLGPISEAGRLGWACHPEQAAGAKHVRESELPVTAAP